MFRIPIESRPSPPKHVPVAEFENCPTLTETDKHLAIYQHKDRATRLPFIVLSLRDPLLPVVEATFRSLHDAQMFARWMCGRPDSGAKPSLFTVCLPGGQN